MAEHLLDVRGLCISFVGRDGSELEAVNNLDLHIDAGEIVGVVGESGCGKSVFAQSIMRLLEHEQKMAYRGEIFFDGENLLERPLKRMREVRGCDIAMIFQDPLSSLNPVMTVGAQVVEAVRAHRKVTRREARAEALELLERVGIRDVERRFDMYPSDFSGGMRQRVMIAMALAGHPRLLIADEPTTALDTTTQKQILDLLRELNRSEGMAVLLISHDLGVVASVCSRVHVMYLGQVVEEIDACDLMERPGHPYAQGLIASIPPLEGPRADVLPDIRGSVPPLTDIPHGCRFAPRCDFATERCRSQEPPTFDQDACDHVKCWRAEKGECYGCGA